MGENIEVIWAEFSTLRQAVCFKEMQQCDMYIVTDRVENMAHDSLLQTYYDRQMQYGQNDSHHE